MPFGDTPDYVYPVAFRVVCKAFEQAFRCLAPQNVSSFAGALAVYGDKQTGNTQCHYPAMKRVGKPQRYHILTAAGNSYHSFEKHC